MATTEKLSFGKKQMAHGENYMNTQIMILLVGTPNAYLSHIVRKPFFFCICENKDADQLRRNRKADQRLCFRYKDSEIPLLSKSEISSLYPFSVAASPGLCRTRLETRMLVFSRRGSNADLFLYKRKYEKNETGSKRVQLKRRPLQICR